MTATITIHHVAVEAKWTDSGRHFAQGQGYSRSGAVDWLSYIIANAMLGNDLHNPALEITFGGITLCIDTDILCCLSGAKTKATLTPKAELDKTKPKGKDIKANTPFLLSKNDLLTVDTTETGVYCYLAFAAVPKLALFKNSVCAVKRESSGGQHFDGTGVVSGDSFSVRCKALKQVVSLCSNGLTCLDTNLDTNLYKKHHQGTLLNDFCQSIMSAQLLDEKHVPVCFSYQHEDFANIEKAQFLRQPFIVTAQLDRMGIRLKGRALQTNRTQLLSQPIAPGSIQISGDGQAIIMRNERQTIGGYPIIATVSAVGLAIISQARPQQRLSFFDCSIERAHTEKLLIYKHLENISTKQAQLLFNSPTANH